MVFAELIKVKVGSFLAPRLAIWQENKRLAQQKLLKQKEVVSNETTSFVLTYQGLYSLGIGLFLKQDQKYRQSI